MDWINEKLEKLAGWIRNLRLKEAMLAYIVILAAATLLLTAATSEICKRWISIVYDADGEESVILYSRYRYSVYSYGDPQNVLYQEDAVKILLLSLIRQWCPYVYCILGFLITAMLFYRNRLRHPFEVLQAGMDKVESQNLDFHISYDSLDEMGDLCRSFEQMRGKLEENHETMWKLVEDQKQLNAAFAHDLRTPLTVLRGYSEFLAKYDVEGRISPEKLKATLELMASQTRRLESYSYTMKEIRSLNEVPLNAETVSLQYLLREITGILHALNEAGGVAMNFEAPKEHGQEILLDSGIFFEVLENLLSNAIRYANSEILVSLEADQEEGLLRLYVQDDGPGFCAEALQKAVRPYYTEEDKAEKSEHFGIGLHICDTLCKKHGGSLNVANRLGRTGAIVGASFRILQKNERNY